MAAKNKGFGAMNLDGIGKEVDKVTKPTTKKSGRPKTNPYPEEKQLTLRVPEDIHRRLKYASVDLDKSMVELGVVALIDFLNRHEGKK